MVGGEVVGVSVVVVGGEGVGVVPKHSILQVAKPEESLLSDRNISFIGFVFVIDGDLDLQKLQI